MAWFTNPFQQFWFLPVVLPLLCLFVLAALALSLVQRTHGLTSSGQLTLMQQTLWQRYRTWLWIAVLYIGAVLCGPLTLALLCAFLIVQGASEYVSLVSLAAFSTLLLTLAGLLTLLALLLFGRSALLVVPILAFFFCTLLPLFAAERGLPLEKGMMLTFCLLWGYLYIAWLPAHLVALALSPFPALLITLGLGVALSDIGAFCLGKLLQGPKLAPILSPAKTWGGLPGNFCGALVAVVLTRPLLPALSLWQILLVALAIACGSIWGDLLESFLKRVHGVKDAGTLLPGFGGLLDRIDSLLLAAPLLYYLSLWLFTR